MGDPNLQFKTWGANHNQVNHFQQLINVLQKETVIKSCRAEIIVVLLRT